MNISLSTKKIRQNDTTKNIRGEILRVKRSKLTIANFAISDIINRNTSTKNTNNKLLIVAGKLFLLS